MDEGRTERFQALYDETRLRIVAYALRRAASPEDAADVVAETYAIAWRRLDDVPRSDDAILWLYVTARHVLLNEARRLRRRSNLVARIASELPAKSDAKVPPYDEERLVALASLRALPADDQELLMLAGWEGLSTSEIARVLGCSLTAVRVRLHRMRRRLQEIIDAPTVVETASKKHSGGFGHTQDNAAIQCLPEEA